MTKILLLLVSAALVTFSFFARAETAHEVSTLVHEVELNNDNLIMTISGQLSTPCAALPRPKLTVVDLNMRVLLLNVVATQETAACISIPGPQYQLAFDIRSLKKDLANLNIDENSSYTLVSKTGWKQTIDFNEITFNKSFSSRNLVGKVLSHEDGSGFSIVNNAGAFVIVSPAIDLAAFVDETVLVQGHVLNKRTPGTNFNNNEQPATFLITGINSTPL